MRALFRYDHATVSVGDTVWVQRQRGWNKHAVTAYKVERKTPTGQITAGDNGRQIRVNARGRVIGHDRAFIVSEETAREIQAECREDALWSVISGAIDGLTDAAHERNPERVRACLARVADGLEKLPTHSEAEV